MNLCELVVLVDVHIDFSIVIILHSITAGKVKTSTLTYNKHKQNNKHIKHFYLSIIHKSDAFQSKFSISYPVINHTQVIKCIHIDTLH